MQAVYEPNTTFACLFARWCAKLRLCRWNLRGLDATWSIGASRAPTFAAPKCNRKLWNCVAPRNPIFQRAAPVNSTIRHGRDHSPISSMPTLFEDFPIGCPRGVGYQNAKVARRKAQFPGDSSFSPQSTGTGFSKCDISRVRTLAHESHFLSEEIQLDSCRTLRRI